MDGQVFHIQGMTCGGCAKHVEKALRAVPGVTSVQVDVSQGTALVAGTTAFEDLAKAVAEAGYEMKAPA
jgi:copper chaperone CopZ